MITFEMLQSYSKCAVYNIGAFSACLWCVSIDVNRGGCKASMSAEHWSWRYFFNTTLTLRCVHLHPLPISSIFRGIDSQSGSDKNAAQPSIFNACVNEPQCSPMSGSALITVKTLHHSSRVPHTALSCHFPAPPHPFTKRLVFSAHHRRDE